MPFLAIGVAWEMAARVRAAGSVRYKAYLLRAQLGVSFIVSSREH